MPKLIELNDADRLSLAATLDGLEIAVGGTVTQVHHDALRSVSARLTAVPEQALVAAVPVAEEPKPVRSHKSIAPKT